MGMNLNDLFINNWALKNNPILSSRLMALCQKITKTAQDSSSAARARIQSPASAAKMVYDSNRLGPIVFCTPELGRWSTVGGLGVMVDELSVGLRALGQEVVVISPYYDRNRKGVTGYLANARRLVVGVNTSHWLLLSVVGFHAFCLKIRIKLYLRDSNLS